jgi:hypothetical protein
MLLDEADGDLPTSDEDAAAAADAVAQGEPNKEAAAAENAEVVSRAEQDATQTVRKRRAVEWAPLPVGQATPPLGARVEAELGLDRIVALY